MYQDLGWNVEETWRGYKHWDRMQTGIKFRVSIILNHYKYNDVVVYQKEKKTR